MGKTVELSFATLTMLSDDIAEVQVHEGVELTLDMVNLYHNTLLAHLKAPFSVLINKVNAYTYTFEAQLKIGTLAQINAQAVVVYSNVSRAATESFVRGTPRDAVINLRMFDDKTHALAWLQQQQAAVKKAKSA